MTLSFLSWSWVLLEAVMPVDVALVIDNAMVAFVLDLCVKKF